MERKKKSRKEVVLELVEQRGLVSFMNTIKWNVTCFETSR